MLLRGVLLGAIFLGSLLFTGIADADLAIDWDRTYGGLNEDACLSFAPTSEGSYLLGGYTRSMGAGASDFWLIKADANGDSLWSRTYGGINTEVCLSLLETHEGDYVLVGYTYSFGAGSNDFWLVKTDRDGDLLWSRTYGDNLYDYCVWVSATPDSGFVLAGYGGLLDSFDAAVVKTDASGVQQWRRTFGGSGSDQFRACWPTDDGGYILAGNTNSFGAGDYDAWLFKIAANGDSLWSRTFGGSASDQFKSGWTTDDGGYLLAGTTGSFGAGDFDFWLLRTDANGDSLWSRTFGGAGQEICLQAERALDGGYLLAGRTGSFGAGGYDFWLVRTDAGGDSLWSYTFGGVEDERCHGVRQTEDGSYRLAGGTKSFGSGDEDFWLVKAVAVPADVDDPASRNAGTLSVSPTPFRGTASLRFALSETRLVHLSVHDVAGRVVGRLAEGAHPPGEHILTFDGGRYPAGVYFFRLRAGARVETTRSTLFR